MPSSGARSGTPSKKPPPAGDGRIMGSRALACGCAVHRDQQPVAAAGGRRWYTCPNDHGLQAARR